MESIRQAEEEKKKEEEKAERAQKKDNTVRGRKGEKTGREKSSDN